MNTPIENGYPKARLSDAEKAVLRATREHCQKYRTSPSYDEIALYTERSKSTVRHIIARLIRKGMLGKTTGSVRNLYVTPLGMKTARRRK